MNIIIYSHRSAISAYRDKINSKPIGQHKKACDELMSGVFNLNSPKPKHVFIWDRTSISLCTTCTNCRITWWNIEFEI